MKEDEKQKAIAFKQWCEDNAWKLDYEEQHSHSNEELYVMWKSKLTTPEAKEWINNVCNRYEPDNTTAMNCKNCGYMKCMH